eukprot:CAMPEP_0118957748 /NCGR_PEP_ID=MMETSP1169-20130426/62265_1 /TAXON_ID=36882 /ORGANISM="Pyramimonas obovata, Strain CCMP722" /LENGTH=209 /DNA_ID=CAMNT_0006905847 /DNA_START=1281 /DNA_END=1909 /DNA_ORIENTATION=+
MSGCSSGWDASSVEMGSESLSCSLTWLIKVLRELVIPWASSTDICPVASSRHRAAPSTPGHSLSFRSCLQSVGVMLDGITLVLGSDADTISQHAFLKAVAGAGQHQEEQESQRNNNASNGRRPQAAGAAGARVIAAAAAMTAAAIAAAAQVIATAAGGLKAAFRADGNVALLPQGRSCRVPAPSVAPRRASVRRRDGLEVLVRSATEVV